ncbi:peptidylprolyl isomerase [Alicyclobacillus cycloheptanicus]|uniref:Foldase protein PrsA n=1 Tax=Alicyclobacillus cycloheptanicus TaxID=1457 RepID=A0ABT9XKA6_9BACL|nr:peptidylprolyl isomerase [Alicyclobacillus cycloheptanicus]MDQ0190156.1 foldase protein PrsA [Alicyclobacillus cycloheptanicus]WDM02589.1 peptidylprolyl isomerase [Alicyclobacillus cycloheptanicus]
MPNRKHVFAGVTAALLITVAAAGCGTAKPANNTTSTNQTTASTIPQPNYTGPTVATYNGGKLTKQELDQQYNLQVVWAGQQSKETKQQFATWYTLYYKYLYQKAAAAVKTPIDVAAAQSQANSILSEMANASSGGPYKTTAQATNKLKSLGLSKSDLVHMVERTQVLNTYLEQQVYNDNKSLFQEVTVDEILLPTEAQAKQIEAKLKAGANFAKLADQYSKDPSVKQNHGTYANALVAEFVPNFAKACRTLPIGKISDPVHTQYGYHILRVDKRGIMPFSQARTQIEQGSLPQSVMQTLQNDIQKIAAQAEKDANIKIVAKASDL